LRFLAVLTAILAGVYAYLAARLAPGPWTRLALALPFVLIWLIPAIYWVGDRDRNTRYDELLHFASYLCMGWLNFALLLTLARDAVLLATGWNAGGGAVLAGSFIALAAGFAAALGGPRIRKVDIPIDGLDPALHGLRIVQITDLHVGPTLGGRYVRKVVRMANQLRADIVALTGDFVDGSVSRLAPHVAALAELQPADRRFFVLGNHECYSGAPQWIEHFRAMGLQVLLNDYRVLSVAGAKLVVGGVLDPAAGQPPQPQLAAGSGEGPAFRLLLAHNPKIAPLAERAGFDLQLSGHTHAGQFFPWTLAVHLVHAPHVSGLSRSGRMFVYVSAGTGTWGPPVRFGTEPELTLLRLVRSPE
jgi:predicted MPP superfamily phosphohydrolase